MIVCRKPVTRPLREISMSAGRNPKTAARKDEDTAGSCSASLGSTGLVGITGRQFCGSDTRADFSIKAN
jgi:hypothetical protein